MSVWNFKDLTGQKFGCLTVVERAETKNKRAFWKCRCDCGNEPIVQAGHLVSGHTQSCGCLKNKKSMERRLTHGMARTHLYQVWNGIKNRCFNTKVKSYSSYGGRGITIYPEWKDNFQAFYDYVSKLEHFGEEGYSLDRINNDGNYEPNNLRWADRQEQCRNRRTNIIVEYNGVMMTLVEASELSGISYATLRRRYNVGDTRENFFRPVKKRL